MKLIWLKMIRFYEQVFSIIYMQSMQNTNMTWYVLFIFLSLISGHELRYIRLAGLISKYLTSVYSNLFQYFSIISNKSYHLFVRYLDRNYLSVINFSDKLRWSLRATWAAACCANLILRSVPTYSLLPKWSRTVYILAWAGPDSFSSRYSANIYINTIRFSCTKKHISSVWTYFISSGYILNRLYRWILLHF
jgi:hypothetical protein